MVNYEIIFTRTGAMVSFLFLLIRVVFRAIFRPNLRGTCTLEMLNKIITRLAAI